MHLNTELKDQFDDFDRFLADQRQILERAGRYLDDRPRPLAQFLEDEQRAIEQVFRDLEEKLEPLGRYLKEQQKFRTQDGGRNKLLARLLEQTRQADLRLQESLKLLPREQEDPRPHRLEAAS